MFSKKTNMIVFPEWPGKIKRFKVPRFLFPLFFLFLISWTACLSWMFWDYYSMKFRLSRLDWFKLEEGRNQMRFSGLERHIDRFAPKIDQLEEFILNLEYMLDLETRLSYVQFPGMGGSDADLYWPDRSKEKGFRHRFRLIHQSLNEIDERIDVLEYGQARCRKFMEDRELILTLVRPVWPKKGGRSTDRPVIQFLIPSSRSLLPLPAYP